MNRPCLASLFIASCFAATSAPARAEMPASFENHLSLSTRLGSAAMSYNAIGDRRSADASVNSDVSGFGAQFWLTDRVGIAGAVSSSSSESTQWGARYDNRRLVLNPSVVFRFPEESGRFWTVSVGPSYERSSSATSRNLTGVRDTSTDFVTREDWLGVSLGAAYLFTVDRFFFGPEVGANVVYGWSRTSGKSTEPGVVVAPAPDDAGLAANVIAGFAVGAVL